MRYAKPDASKLQRTVGMVGKLDDPFLVVMPGIVGSTLALSVGIGMAAENGQPLFLLLLGVPVLFLLVVLLYITGTEDLRWDGVLDRAEKLMESIRGTDVEYLAAPVYAKIFEHVRLNKHDTRNTEKCADCAARETVLEELTPARLKSSDTGDLEAARMYLDIRKEIGG